MWDQQAKNIDFIRNSRELTNGEINMSKPVFGNKIDYSLPRVVSKPYVPWQPNGTAMAPNGNIYFNPKDYKTDFSQASKLDRGWFIHEMTHVMQYQNGINVLANGLLFQTGKILSVGLYDPYKFSYIPGKAFGAYNLEQQGDVARGIYYGKLPNIILGR